MTESVVSFATKQDLLAKSESLLEPVEVSYIEEVLDRVPGPSLHLADLWQLLNEAWDDMGLDNACPDWDGVGKFYDHPIWLLNGLFAETDQISENQRKAWRDWLISDATDGSAPIRAADFGGGFGSLAAILAKEARVDIDIIDPHPPAPAYRRFAHQNNVRFIPLLGIAYDYIFCSDVLEHVHDPIGTLIDLVEATKPGGKLMIANNFYPVIKCHLPSTFHLRYSFGGIARTLGLDDLGPLSCGHGQVYRRSPDLRSHPNRARVLETISKAGYPVIRQLDRARFFFLRTIRI